MSLSPLPNYIDGEPVASRAASALEVRDPRTGEIVALCPVSVQEDVDAAYAAAQRAFSTWRLTTPAQRQELLLKLADAIEEAADELVAAQQRNTGQLASLIRTDPQHLPHTQ